MVTLLKVFGMVERTTQRKIIFIPVEKRDKATLHALIKKYVAPGSIVRTDGWRGYRDLPSDFEHQVVNHSRFFRDPETGVHTNTIEGNWAPFKNTF